MLPAWSWLAPFLRRALLLQRLRPGVRLVLLRRRPGRRRRPIAASVVVHQRIAGRRRAAEPVVAARPVAHHPVAARFASRICLAAPQETVADRRTVDPAVADPAGLGFADPTGFPGRISARPASRNPVDPSPVHQSPVGQLRLVYLPAEHHLLIARPACRSLVVHPAAIRLHPRPARLVDPGTRSVDLASRILSQRNLVDLGFAPVVDPDSAADLVVALDPGSAVGLVVGP